MANEIVYVNLNVVDGKNRTSTIQIPFRLDALTSVISLIALTKRVGAIVSKLTTAGLKKAEICLGVDVTAISWDNVDGGTDVSALGDVQEKALFAFLTEPDAIGVQRTRTMTIPAVNDEVVFLAGQDAIDDTDADVLAFINLIRNGVADLSAEGGSAGDVVTGVDTRGLDIVSFQYGNQTWGNRRK